MKQQILILCKALTLFLLFSCQQEQAQKMLNIIPSQFNEHSEMYESVELQKVILLDQSTNFGDIYRIHTAKEGHVLVSKSEETAYFTNHTGQVTSTVHHVGKGPKEYSDLFTSYFNKYTKQLGLVEMTGKTIVYDPKGEYVETIQGPTSSMGIAEVCYLDASRKAEYRLSDKYNLYIQNSASKQEQGLIPFIPARDFSFSQKAFSSFNGKTLFTQAANDTIYQIEADEFNPKYIVNFGEAGVDATVYTERPNELENVYARQAVACLQDNLCHNKDFLSFSYLLFDPKREDGQPLKQYVFFNKNTDEYLQVKDDNVLFPIYDVSEDGYFVSLIDPILVQESDNDTKLIRELKEYIKANEVKWDGNPLLVYWRSNS